MQSQLTVIVPGIAGSKIYCHCVEGKTKRLYPRRHWFFNSAIDEHMYECQNIGTKPLRSFWNISIYDKFIRKLNSCSFNSVRVFSYDWRRTPVEIADEFLGFLQQLNPGKYAHMKLIGHSLGGLVIRIMLEYMRGLDILNITTERVTVYQCGTPMYGSPHIQDYNYGFELAAILASLGVYSSSCPTQKVTKRDVRKIKPFLFSVSDLKKILNKCSPSLMYLLPTPMIFTLQSMLTSSQLRINEDVDFETIYKVHFKLGELNFPVKYIYFFNISCQRIENVYVPFCKNDIFTKINIHDIRPGSNKFGCGVHLNRLMKSDGLVVPFCGQKIPQNCNIYVDESEKCRHAYLMNSTELWRIALNSQTNFEYYNVVEDERLPGYDELFGAN
ncbi:prolyl oligopeptidase family [Drosophila suzukii associated hytrosavirus 1]|nr:prolyl oligopeptidase family [Drosophila suzukii associated hytrosavirus 1]